MLHYARMMLSRFAGVGGGGGTLDTQTVTTGASGTAVNQDRVRGFVNGGLGAIADGTSNVYAGAAFLQLYWDENGGGGADQIVLTIAGAQANSGWTSITIGAVTLARGAANFIVAGGNSSWTWPNTNYLATTQPFGGNGAVKTVTFQ